MDTGVTMKTTLDDRAAGNPPPGGSAGRRVLAGMLLPAIAAAIAVAGLRVHVPGSLPAVQAVAFGLVLAGALSGAVLARAPQRVAQWQVVFGALAASVALTTARIGDEVSGAQHQAARSVATLAVPFVIAISVHLLLALPDGRLAGRGRQAGAGLAYAAAASTGVVLVIAGRPFPSAAAAVAWPLATACALPAVRLRYQAAEGRDKQRMQWMAVGAMLAADTALVAGVLHVLVMWPGAVAAVAAGCAIFLPLGMMAGGLRGLGPYGGRVLVQVLSIAGFTVVVAAIYLVIVFGIGTAPRDSGGREILGLSMLAAAVAAIGYLPARDRLVAAAKRFVYGAREAPDEALRTFGSRLTRAIPMDELLLQLAESLRKTMGLTSAEVYSGTGEVLERVVSVPDAGPRSVIVTARERPVVTRAGVSGSAWASVWLPALLDGREHVQLRVAPVSHAGELLGLIVVERPAAADAFADDDDRVLTELARQVGLAVHNARLDTALQTSLDELRRQADELRRSRARIVASGDAERRRVERNLHDGAQQHLVAMAVNLRIARDIIADDPPAAAEMLDQLADDVKDTIRELRELAHGIYPPLLADSGLGEAMRAAGNRSPLPVAVSAEGIGRYTPEIEAAVYFCCLEALQNAAKHAPQARVQVRLWEESGGLLFSVADDGPGFDAEAARGGHGFVNMADRLGAIGGTVRWESQPGHSSRVLGSVPLL
ncbi:MAG TPA: histidine kinase [Streptosporangiaceae bacterium]|nr:histidine kinase [Streptosporangiaceae bacterium]